MSANERTGGQILIDQLRLHGVELIFGVPGESYLPALDALYDVPEIRFIVCRQEGGAAMMADAYGKLTGRPGVAFVTRGPGASNASAGVHIAEQDSTPMLLLVGQIDRGAVGRGTFQEVDYRQFFGGMVKWAAEVDDPGRLPELVHRAFMTATSGRPGPVVLSLPEDMLAQRSGAGDARPFRPVEAAPSSEALDRLRSMLEAAQRPILIVGGGGWNAQATADLARFVEANELPMAAGFRRQDLLDNEHPCYAGDIAIGPNPKLVQRIRGSDLIVAIGTRLSEMTTQGYSLLGVPRPEQPLVHIHNDPAELGRVYQPDLAISLRYGRARPRTCRHAARRAPALGRGDAVLPMPTTSPGASRRRFPAACSWARWSSGCAAACRPTRSSPTVRATIAAGSTASSRMAAFGPSLLPRQARWAMASRLRSPPRSPSRSARSSPSPATAAS